MNKNQSDQPVDDKVIEIVQELDPNYSVKPNLSTNRDLEARLEQLQESLDYLRVCIKYQTFDLEATRRENIHLRKLLDGPVELNQDDEPCMG